MIILMGGSIDVECQCKLAIPLKPSALLIAFECLLEITFGILRRETLRLLFDTLTFTSDEYLVLTGFVLLAWDRRVAWSHTRVTADAELLPTWLFAWFFTFTGTMALFLAGVSAALQSSPAYLATSDVNEPAWLIFNRVLSAQALLGG